MASGPASQVNDWQTVQSPDISDWQTVSGDNSKQADSPSLLSRAKSFVGDTLSKTAHNMNVENTLRSIDDLTSGDFERAIHAVPNPVSHIVDAAKAGASGDIKGMIQHTIEAQIPGSEIAADTIHKLYNRDYSGAIANILPFAFAAGGSETVAGAPAKAAAALSDAADLAPVAAKGAVSGVIKGAKANPAVPATATALSFVPGAHAIGPAVDAAFFGYHGIKGAAEAIAKKIGVDKAQADWEAEVAKRRADQQPYDPNTGASTDPSLPTVRASPNPPAPTAAPRITQAQQQGVDLQPSPKPETAPPLTPEEKLDAASWMAKRLAERKQQPALKVKPPEVQAEATASDTAKPAIEQPANSVKAELDPELLNATAVQLAKKPYSKLNASEKLMVDGFVSRLKPKEQVVAEQKSPAAQPVLPVINEAANQGKAIDVAVQTPDPVPSIYREAFEGDKGGTLSPQETNARAHIVLTAVPKLLREGFKPEDLNTEEGQAKAVEFMSQLPGLSKNKAISEYLASPKTIDAIHALMSQWAKYGKMMGIPN